jgi:hypothetical protein
MDKQPVTPVEIYTEYVRLRQGGWSQEAAVQQLQPKADLLSKGDRKQLGQIIIGWEEREGTHFKPGKRSPLQTPPIGAETSTSTPDQLSGKPIIRRIGTPSKSENVPAFVPAFTEIPHEVNGIRCSNCGKFNDRHEAYCYSCGNVLSLSQSGTKILEEEAEAKTRLGTAHFGQFSALLFTARGSTTPLEVIAEGEMVIGRVDAENAVRPDVDLSQFGAKDLGVSRLHASLKRLENTVSLSDLNSRNGTYINGQKLHPGEVRVLRDGDEVRFGKLILRIAFKHQIRRLGDR